ncbi:CPBP family intramembrane glutamic endopeptidase [Demequina sp. NBRC 110056]|uniref:CPBP family intramembrane glutamic endopeptidase n=1 Tax=Demequina sp. NBRC 110056 TaxID=1570345 RepID=UPI000A0736B7|nr:CPBP family intramembrane glutamic endopeptidase [Demequina sp. NBRC 110056]
MRIQPRAWIALTIFVVYVAVVLTLWLALGVDYPTMQDTPENALRALVIGIGTGGVLVAIVTTYLGWWRPALVETRRVPRWMWVIPGLFLVMSLLNMLTVEWGALTPGHLATLLAGVIAVGFSEELVTRGTMLVGLRSRLREPLVWLVSTTTFMLLHAINGLVGQSWSGTASQMVVTFLLGSAFYLIRRVSGTLLLGMGLHALYDFSLLTFDASGAEGSTLGGILGVPLYLTVIVAMALAFRKPKPSEPATAETDTTAAS